MLNPDTMIPYYDCKLSIIVTDRNLLLETANSAVHIMKLLCQSHHAAAYYSGQRDSLLRAFEALTLAV